MIPAGHRALAEAVSDADVFLRRGTVAGNSGEMAIATGINLRPRELVQVLDPGGPWTWNIGP